MFGYFGYRELIKPRKWIVDTHNKLMMREVNVIWFLKMCVTINSTKVNVNFFIGWCSLKYECSLPLAY